MQQRLKASLYKVVQRYFPDLADIPDIKLSCGQTKKQRRSIIFGSYNPVKNEIKIHPVLLGSVPDIALEFVIYHELLHCLDRDLLLVREKKTRIHTKKFRQQEKEFTGYDKAQIVLKNLLYDRAVSSTGCSSLEERLAVSVNKLHKILTYYQRKS